MTVRAKFKVSAIEPYSNPTTGEVIQKQVRLDAVYSSDPASENYSWSKYTPSGSASLTITNPDAFNQFVVGEEYFLDFTPVKGS